MSGHAAFRRQPVPGEMAMRYATVTLPAPIRGIIENENWAYTKPGCATVLDNWFPTTKGLKLRGGTERWLSLPTPEYETIRSGFVYISGAVQRMFVATASQMFDVSFADTPALLTGVGTPTDGYFSAAQLANTGGDWLLAVNDSGDYVRRFNGASWAYLSTTTPTAWVISHAYIVGDRALDPTDNTRWKCLVAHTSPGTGTFAAARIASPTQWTQERASDNASFITAKPTDPVPIQNGHGLTHVWKHANRFFFIQGGTMNAWCLPVHSAGGELVYIPLSGATKRGGSLLFGASWSVDSGSGLDDKCIFCTDQGEIVIFSGTDPTSSTNWKQEGCYDISPPIGKNAHAKLGGDILIATIDGIIPLTATMQKDVSALSLAAITYNIEPMWMREFVAKKGHPWSLAKWTEGGALFVNFPNLGNPVNSTVGVSNLHTGAWCRLIGWDAMCFMEIHGALFFGTQDGKIMLAESTGLDDAHVEDDPKILVGNRYVCTMVGGWEMFQAPPNTVTWLQARAAFFSSAREPFEPQLTATVDYEFRVPRPPDPGPDPGLIDVWDQGLWGPSIAPVTLRWANSTAYTTGTVIYDDATVPVTFWEAINNHTSAAPPREFIEDIAHWTSVPEPVPPVPTTEEWDRYAQWDQAVVATPIKHTMWVSIGETGFSHAPVVQVSVAQQKRPDVELVSISATFLRMAVNV